MPPAPACLCAYSPNIAVMKLTQPKPCRKERRASVSKKMPLSRFFRCSSGGHGFSRAEKPPSDFFPFARFICARYSFSSVRVSATKMRATSRLPSPLPDKFHVHPRASPQSHRGNSRRHPCPTLSSAYSPAESALAPATPAKDARAPAEWHDRATDKRSPRLAKLSLALHPTRRATPRRLFPPDNSPAGPVAEVPLALTQEGP